LYKAFAFGQLTCFGDLKVDTVGGDTITFVGVNGGTFFPVQIMRVWATGTTATDIVALW
jgi:hypothetical protein